jgi:hypothetical protein
MIEALVLTGPILLVFLLIDDIYKGMQRRAAEREAIREAKRIHNAQG